MLLLATLLHADTPRPCAAGLLPPGQHEALGDAAFHALRAINLLLLNLAPATTATTASGNAGHGGCATVAAECVAQASRLCGELVKAGLGKAVEASGIELGICGLLEALVAQAQDGTKQQQQAHKEEEEATQGGKEQGSGNGAAAAAMPKFFLQCSLGE